jgi:hypothetical protein
LAAIAAAVAACRFGKHCALMRLGVGLQRAFAASGTTAAAVMARLRPANARLAFPCACYALRGVNQRLRAASAGCRRFVPVSSTSRLPQDEQTSRSFPRKRWRRRHLGGIGLDRVPTRLAPDYEPEMGRSLQSSTRTHINSVT